MIEVNQAVKIALDFVRDLYPKEQLRDLALEEIRLNDDEKRWLITVGFRALSGHTVVRDGAFMIGTPSVEKIPRDYKTVEVDRTTGTVGDMRFHEAS